MKKTLYAVLMLLPLLALAFFTVHGERLYAINKPVVKPVLVETAHVEVEGVLQKQMQIPASALYTENDGVYVYVLESQQGYSRMLHSVRKQAVIYTVRPEGDIYVTRGLRSSDKVIASTDSALADGERVIIQF